MTFDKQSYLLYAVTDRALLRGRALCDMVKDAISGGATMIQLREKSLTYDKFLQTACEIGKLCKDFHIPFIVNDNADIAMQSKACGVHVGQTDMDAAKVRRIIGNEMILGVSVVTVEQALTAQEAGADYLGVGAVFSTTTKNDADFVPIEVLKDICTAVHIPVVAIGGITEDNMENLAGSGIRGVAVVSAVFSAADIRMECEKLYTKSKILFGL